MLKIRLSLRTILQLQWLWPSVLCKLEGINLVASAVSQIYSRSLTVMLFTGMT